MANLPEIRYAKSDGVHIAYQVQGDGPFDMIWVPGTVSHLEIDFQNDTAFYARLASFCRLIRFDKRGTGLSDRLTDIPSPEVRMDDIRAVMDAVGSEKAAIVGFSEGGTMAALFAACHPSRSTAVVACAAFARRLWAPDFPWGRSEAEVAAFLDSVERNWGQGALSLGLYAPSLTGDESVRKRLAQIERAIATPNAALALFRMNNEFDIRSLLPSVRVPTLVIHRAGDRAIKVELGRHLAENIPGAKYVELPGDDHIPWMGDSDSILDEIEGFLTGIRRGPEPDRLLTTLMFTDIVDATAHAATLGDRRWRELLAHHHRLVRDQLGRFRGREIDTAGDGFFASFDGPARAVRCAQSIATELRKVGISIRAGVHTGECEIMGDKLSGIAVHIGARIAGKAARDEVLVSSTVKDLVIGSGLQFEDRGCHALKGVPGEWALFGLTA